MRTSEEYAALVVIAGTAAINMAPCTHGKLYVREKTIELAMFFTMNKKR